METASLVMRFQSGDETAFTELFELYKNQALRSAFLITGNYCDSENVVQESFIKCYQGLAKLKEPTAFKSWFFRILTRTAWQYCQIARREKPVEEIFELQSATCDSTCSILTATETHDLLLAAIDQLELKQKTVIVLYYYNEMSIKEIAAVTGSLTGTVKSRLFTAKRNLQKALQSTKFEEVTGNDIQKQFR